MVCLQPQSRNREEICPTRRGDEVDFELIEVRNIVSEEQIVAVGVGINEEPKGTREAENASASPCLGPHVAVKDTDLVIACCASQSTAATVRCSQA